MYFWVFFIFYFCSLSCWYQCKDENNVLSLRPFFFSYHSTHYFLYLFNIVLFLKDEVSARCLWCCHGNVLNFWSRRAQQRYFIFYLGLIVAMLFVCLFIYSQTPWKNNKSHSKMYQKILSIYTIYLNIVGDGRTKHIYFCNYRH